jgi:hypothetical protein
MMSNKKVARSYCAVGTVVTWWDITWSPTVREGHRARAFEKIV